MCSLHPQEELQSTIEPLNFLDFPEEILWLPFQFLRARDLMQLSSTCKQLYESLSSRRGKLLWSNRVKKQVHPYVIDLHAQEAGEACTASWLWWRKLALLTEEMQSLQLEATVTSVPFQSIGRGPLTAGLGVHDHFAAGAHHAHERPPTLSRSGHTTTTLLNGDVVIVGGVVPQSHYWSVVLEPLVVSSDGQSVQQILTQQRLAHDAEVDRAPRAPCPRLRHAICRIGPATLLLHGGHDLDQFGSAYDDLWSMEITQSAPVGPARPRGSARAMLPYHVTWTRLHTTGSVPGGRSKHTLCATPDGARVVLFGGHETEPGDPTVFVLDVRALCWTAVCTTGDVPQRNQLHVSVWCADTSSMVGPSYWICVGVTHPRGCGCCVPRKSRRMSTQQARRCPTRTSTQSPTTSSDMCDALHTVGCMRHRWCLVAVWWTRCSMDSTKHPTTLRWRRGHSASSRLSGGDHRVRQRRVRTSLVFPEPWNAPRMWSCRRITCWCTVASGRWIAATRTAWTCWICAAATLSSCIPLWLFRGGSAVPRARLENSDGRLPMRNPMTAYIPMLVTLRVHSNRTQPATRTTRKQHVGWVWQQHCHASQARVLQDSRPSADWKSVWASKSLWEHLHLCASKIHMCENDFV
eukprot:m.359649 g.359649  ORF g.359649 m.359649 type:complete len:634 (+) comp20762_c0_seq5:297-2198(+)